MEDEDKSSGSSAMRMQFLILTANGRTSPPLPLLSPPILSPPILSPPILSPSPPLPAHLVVSAGHQPLAVRRQADGAHGALVALGVRRRRGRRREGGEGQMG